MKADSVSTIGVSKESAIEIVLLCVHRERHNGTTCITHRACTYNEQLLTIYNISFLLYIDSWESISSNVIARLHRRGNLREKLIYYNEDLDNAVY